MMILHERCKRTERTMIIINDTLGAYGGGQTLILRICTYLVKNNYKTGILCHDDGNTEIVNKLEQLGVVIKCVKAWETEKLEQVVNEFLAMDSSLTIINFAWNQYLNIELVKRRNHCVFKNIIYCIHPATFEKGAGINNKLLALIVRKLYARTIMKMSRNNAIVFDTEIDQERTEGFLKVKLSGVPVLRIPVFVEDKDNYKDIIKTGFDSNVILTASRAEIPFKGYMLGLIDDFAKLYESNDSYSLKIISAGDDINQIKDRINSLPNAIQKKIFLYGWMTYEQLEEEIRNCKIVVGMGTTILDAAKNYKIAIPVSFYTTENNADDYFGSDYLSFSAPETCKKKAYPLLEQACDWDFDTYYRKCINSFNTVKENYGMENVMSKILEIKTVSDNCCISTFDCFIHNLGNAIRKKRYSGEQEFDYRRIEKFEKK